MRDRDDGARVFGEMPFQPGDGLRVEVVCGLVQEKKIRPLEEDLAERDAPALAARDLRHVRVGGRQSQCVHRDLELAVELPRVRRLDRVLHALVLGQETLAVGLREVRRELLVQLVETGEQRPRRGDGFLDVAENGLRRVEPRVLRQETDPRSLRRISLSGEVLFEPRHDAQESGLAGAVRAEDADLGAGKKREPDSAEDLPLRRNDLPQVDHREDVLVGHGSGGVYYGTGASPTFNPIVPSSRFSYRAFSNPTSRIICATPRCAGYRSSDAGM